MTEQGHGQDDRSGSPDRLERFVDGIARAQQPRRAPAALESRVLSEIAARQPAAAWWRRSFNHWPLAARAAFVIASLGFVKLALSAFVTVSSMVRGRDVVDTTVLHRSAEAVSTTFSVGELVLHAIPPIWLYGAAAFCFGVYLLLFGLGTVAYRTLYVQR